MQYWINHNGVQSGPVDLDGLKEMGLTSSAYIWHEGMSDWVKITQLPELKEYYDQPTTTAEPEQTDNAQAEPADRTTPPPIPVQEASVVQPYQQQPAGPEPCPPTNMAWAVLSTLLCCPPTGIVAIIYAIKVTNKYREGDIKGAKSASDKAAWWCIATIVLGILSYPLVSLLQMKSLS